MEVRGYLVEGMGTGSERLRGREETTRVLEENLGGGDTVFSEWWFYIGYKGEKRGNMAERLRFKARKTGFFDLTWGEKRESKKEERGWGHLGGDSKTKYCELCLGRR